MIKALLIEWCWNLVYRRKYGNPTASARPIDVVPVHPNWLMHMAAPAPAAIEFPSTRRSYPKWTTLRELLHRELSWARRLAPSQLALSSSIR